MPGLRYDFSLLGLIGIATLQQESMSMSAECPAARDHTSQVAEICNRAYPHMHILHIRLFALLALLCPVFHWRRHKFEASAVAAVSPLHLARAKGCSGMRRKLWQERSLPATAKRASTPARNVGRFEHRLEMRTPQTSKLTPRSALANGVLGAERSSTTPLRPRGNRCSSACSVNSGLGLAKPSRVQRVARDL